MTKEENDILLASNYWIGYSHKLIKERHFTCENCGAHYPGKREMFEVHHLVQRDIKPWLYEPEEVMVLCKDCYARRDGIKARPKNPKPAEPKREDTPYCKSYEPQEKKEDSPHGSSILEFSHPMWKKPQMKWFLALLALVLLFCGYKIFSHHAPQPVDTPETTVQKPVEEKAVKDIEKTENPHQIEMKENRKYWEDRARKEGVSTEGSVQDIKDRIRHKFLEERKRKLLE